MENKDEKGTEEPVGRRTRSGKTVSPVVAAAPKPPGKKTRKKVMLVEVEVSDDEDSPVPAKSQEEQETDSGTIINSTETKKEEQKDVIEADSGDTEIATKTIDRDETQLARVAINTDEVTLLDEERQLEEAIEDSLVTNGSEDKEICAIIENDVFEFDFEKPNKNVEQTESEDKIEQNDVDMTEISELIETDTCKLDTEPAVESMDVDLGILTNDKLEGEMQIETDEKVVGDKEEETKGSEDVLTEVKAMEVTEDAAESKEEVIEAKEVMNDVKDETIETKEDVVETKEDVMETKEDVVETKEIKMTEDMDTKEEIVETKEEVETKEMETKEEMEIKEEVVETKEEVKEEKMTKYQKISIQPADPDAENISEDELPSVQVAKVPETEEVSDEELPGPKRAELPADTEVVSEDELPTVKKEGTKRKLAEGDYDPGSPTSENETSAKKPFLELEADKEKDKAEKPKKLPELDKYWKAVNDDPTDFTGWTYLLQYVDQENDMEAAREAYDAFLSHYPYCYGYWRKYADYEKRKGNKKKCEEVFERGLKAIPLSVDLWIHYLTYVRTTKPEDEEFIRSQFERALTACGLEFRSDRLWDSYIKWETDGKRPQSATAIYDRLLTTPTQGYTTHFDNFQEHVTSHPPNKILEVDEFLALRKEVKHMLKHDVTTDATDKADAPPGEDTEEVSTDEETKAIRERIISIRRKIHKNTVTNVTGRWNFEEGIKRPYFHVKPLERCQLKNWQEYLDYEIEHGEKTRIIVLFERCLIACALYEEFWLRFVHYLESLKDAELHGKIKDVYERACTIHHIKKPNLHLQWAMFEESIKNYNKAAEILANIEKSVPNLLQVANRRINLERRREDYDKCSQLYEHYIVNSKNKIISTNLSMKYARFCHRILKNIDKALEVLNSALSRDTNNPRIYLQLIDMTMQKEPACEKEIIQIIDSFLEKESTEVEQKILFAQRKLEFLEDFGSDIQCVQTAYDDYQKYIKLNKETKKKETKSEPTGKKEKNPPLPSSQASTYGNYGNYGNSSSTGPYPYSGGQQGQYNYSQYGQSDQYQYGNWQYPQGGYSGYNQWSGYSGGYGY